MLNRSDNHQDKSFKTFRHIRGRLCHITSFLKAAFVLLLLTSWPGRSRAADEPTEPSLPKVKNHPGFDFSVWELVPIQEGGLEKSLYTFAKETVREVTGSANYGGRGAMENMFSMAFEPEAWINEPLLKIRHPELRKILGVSDKSPYISPLALERAKPEWGPKVEKSPKSAEIKTELGHLFSTGDLLLAPAQKLTIVPTQNFRGEKDLWRTIEDVAVHVREKSPAEEKLVASWEKTGEAFLKGDAAGFNQASADVVGALGSLGVPTFVPEWKIKLDRWDSHVGLFRLAGWTYCFSALIFLVSYLAGKNLAGKKLFSALAGASLGLGALFHVSAMVIRGILANRTPVANLFESAVFIIAVMTVMSIAISAYYRTRVVGLGGATLGAFFMGIANNIPLQYGRKILPLIDALQSYWLHIHVTSMLTSYAFFALAFFVAVCYLVRRVMLIRRAGYDVAADATLLYLDSLTFRIITIGFPILTGGVILGAVWASEAWGRPWGFDPKETAAAITWMIYALYLHFRLFMGWRGPKGIWLSVLGFAAVVFTYLGVSFFLPGLHSYVEKDGVSFAGFLKQIFHIG